MHLLLSLPKTIRVRITKVLLHKVTRLGKRKENAPRPILVMMEDETSKWKCLKQAPKLRNDSKFCNVYISPDLTLEERQENKKLYLELKRCREKGEKDLMIKNGKIIKRTSTSNQQSSYIHMRTHTRTHTHARTHARTHTRTHTHTNTGTFSLSPGLPCCLNQRHMACNLLIIMN